MNPDYPIFVSVRFFGTNPLRVVRCIANPPSVVPRDAIRLIPDRLIPDPQLPDPQLPASQLPDP